MNKQMLKIKKLWDRGIHDPRLIAKKMGYKGSAMDSGIAKVKELLEKLSKNI